MLKKVGVALVVAGGLAAGLFGMLAAPVAAQAQDVTLKLHQFLPLQATIPSGFLQPWIEKVQAESGGRIKIEHYPSMQLGGAPPQLIQQATDGAVDMIWTVLGYTPGRFPRAEAFELPFVPADAVGTSVAFQEYAEKYMADDFPGLKIIAVHTHGPGLIHSTKPINKLEDIKGVKLRGPTRVTAQTLETLGATAISMPVPSVPEALSKGIIDGAVIPWEVTLPREMSELAESHTGFSGKHGLYTATFVFTMNQTRYDNLPDDLKKVIDDNSGVMAAAWAGRVMEEGDAAGLKAARDAGNTIITLDEAETQRWIDASAPVIDAWIDAMDDRDIDGQALVDAAQSLIAKNTE
ncbi:TRAP transporter substrate-binding protein [Rhodospirillaceae bacterium KN72]|uniref:TRAP transporter substrate-binding protein n=1 Tax=Pacificispira spongiicola TaxID=2729598 RepID=A0A7Y0E3Q4_9PROT|nr:TRAP transporter substrate-binding protein [Pacificispira spongiicola]NMM46680.1 TRAP transporter substrate-binding protein [Pacificispira spongiicola]